MLGTPRDVGADTIAETIDDCRAANDCRRMKNALQMDPVATGIADQRFITKVYIGDLDGKVWRFDLDSPSSGTVNVATPTQLYDAGADYPLFASMATVNVGSTNQYLFIGTGSDLLPSNSVNQSYSLLVLLDNGGSATKTAEILLERTDWPPAAGGDEKVTAFPAVAGDIVFFYDDDPQPDDAVHAVHRQPVRVHVHRRPGVRHQQRRQLSTGSSGRAAARARAAVAAAALRPTAPRSSRRPAFAPRRHSSSISIWCSRPAASSSCSATPTTSTTASARPACAFCPGAS